MAHSKWLDALVFICLEKPRSIEPPPTMPQRVQPMTKIIHKRYETTIEMLPQLVLIETALCRYTKHTWTRMSISKPFSWLCSSIESMSTWLASDDVIRCGEEFFAGIGPTKNHRSSSNGLNSSISYFGIILNPKKKAKEKQTAFENILRGSGNCEKLIRWLLVFHLVLFFSFCICVRVGVGVWVYFW